MNLIQTYFSEDHQTFRASFKAFLEKEVLPHVEAWEEAGEVPRYIYQKMGEMGYFGLGLPEDLGGSGIDFFYDVIFLEELGKLNCRGFDSSCWSFCCGRRGFRRRGSRLGLQIGRASCRERVLRLV